MKSVYSLVRFVSNPLSRENITIGLIVISEGKVFYNFSQSKITLISKINAANFKLVNYTIGKIQSFLENEVKFGKLLFNKDAQVNYEYLNRLSVYNNGFIQFDKPLAIDMVFDQERFDAFFNRHVGLPIQKQAKKDIDKSFRNTIERVFAHPLRDIIDINVKIKKEQIKGLYFDYKLDGIGINSILYTVKSIDLNAEGNAQFIQREIAEFETLSYRLDCLVKAGDLNNVSLDSNKRNKHYLVIDNYVGQSDLHRRLYEILTKSENPFPYQIINSQELGPVTEEIKSSGAGKFMHTLQAV
jgi:hypothetical protein